MQARCQALERQVEILTKKSTESNVVMHVTKIAGSNSSDIAKAACEDMLKDKHAVKSLRAVRSGNTTADTLVVELRKSGDVQKLVKASTALKAKGISVHRDYPLAARMRRKQMMEIKNNVQAKCPSLQAKIQGEKLLVDGKAFHIQNDTLMCGDSDGFQILQQIIATASTSSLNESSTSSSTANHNNKPSTSKSTSNESTTPNAQAQYCF